jgi:choline dehydrogenase-like flavoprotein
MAFTSFCISALAIASQANALSWEQPAGLPRYGSFFGLPGKNATYDYVIVGGGTAGLTVASRLAEDRSLSVAVVEAGTFSEISNGNSSQVPAYSFGSVAGGGDYVNPWIDWELETTPQPVRILETSGCLMMGDTDFQPATPRQKDILRSRQSSRRQQHSQSDDLPARVSWQL